MATARLSATRGASPDLAAIAPGRGFTRRPRAAGGAARVAIVQLRNWICAMCDCGLDATCRCLANAICRRWKFVGRGFARRARGRGRAHCRKRRRRVGASAAATVGRVHSGGGMTRGGARPGGRDGCYYVILGSDCIDQNKLLRRILTGGCIHLGFLKYNLRHINSSKNNIACFEDVLS